MPPYSNLNAEQVVRIIAGQRQSAAPAALQDRIIADCAAALPNAHAEGPVDALALLVVARQVIGTLANDDPDAPILSEEDRRYSLEWSTRLVSRVIAMFEAQTGIAAESFIADRPQAH